MNQEADNLAKSLGTALRDFRGDYYPPSQCCAGTKRRENARAWDIYKEKPIYIYILRK